MSKNKEKLKIVKPESIQQKSQLKIVKPKPRYRKKKPVFAFNYYLCDSKKCSFKTIKSSNSFHIFFKHLKGMSPLTWQEIINANQFHAHDVKWTENKLPNDIKQLQNNEKIKDLPLFQFKAFDIEETRIIGLFNYDDIFEIIGLDIEHETYGKNK